MPAAFSRTVPPSPRGRGVESRLSSDKQNSMKAYARKQKQRGFDIIRDSSLWSAGDRRRARSGGEEIPAEPLGRPATKAREQGFFCARTGIFLLGNRDYFAPNRALFRTNKDSFAFRPGPPACAPRRGMRAEGTAPAGSASFGLRGTSVGIILNVTPREPGERRGAEAASAGAAGLGAACASMTAGRLVRRAMNATKPA